MTKHAKANPRIEAAARAAEALARAGVVVDVDALDGFLAEVADKAEGTFRQWRDAMLVDQEWRMPFPVAAVDYLLAITAALRAAVGYSDTPTAREIVTKTKVDDVATVAGDPMRLHLFARHGMLLALWLSDRQAGSEHELAHQSHSVGHELDDIDWSRGAIEGRLAQIPETESRSSYAAAFGTLITRVEGQVASAGVGGDRD